MDADAAKQTDQIRTYRTILGTPRTNTEEKKRCAKEYEKEKSLISYIYPLLQSN